MLETILLIVVGAFVYSVVQSFRRGDASPAERKQNPTLLESAEKVAGEAAERARKYRSQTEFKINHCGWFGRFERTVSRALEYAEDDAEREAKLAADPLLRKFYEDALASYSAQEREAKQPTQNDIRWAYEGPPPPPLRKSDAEMDAIFERIYQDHLERHKAFVLKVRKNLERQPAIREHFDRHLRILGLQFFLNRHFPTEEAAFQLQSKATGEPKTQNIISETLDLARSVDDPSRRSRALIKVAECQADAGDLASAKDTAAEALSVAQGAPCDNGSEVGNLGWRDQALADVARLQAFLADVSGALETARSIESTNLLFSSRSEILAEIALEQAKLGDASGAKATALSALYEARTISDAKGCCRALLKVAGAQAEVGEYSQARATAHEALRAAQKIKSKEARRFSFGGSRTDAFANVAEVQAAAGDLSGAIETARMIEDASQSARALVRIVSAQAKTGDISRALEISRTIPCAEDRCAAIIKVALAQAGTGSSSGLTTTIAEALRAVLSIADTSKRPKELAELLGSLAGAGDVSGALEIARNVPGAEARCRALASVAIAQAGDGDQQSAKRAALDALAVAQTVETKENILGALGQIAAAHAKAGDLSGALRIARGIESAPHRSFWLTEIGEIQLETGDKLGAQSTAFEALEAARITQEDGFRFERFRRVAELQAAAGDAAGALKTAGSVGNAQEVFYALERVARAHAKMGRLSQALDIARGIEDTEKRANATISIAIIATSRDKCAAREGVDDVEPTACRQLDRKSATYLRSVALSKSSRQIPPTLSAHKSEHRSDKEAIAEIVEERMVTHLVHFTQADNLPSIFHKGIVSVQEAKTRGIQLISNDAHRFDGYLDGISLSISYPNYKMLYKFRRIYPERRWMILLIDPAILWELKCGFCRFNAADRRIPKGRAGELAGSERFSELFDRSLPSEDRDFLRQCDPTDPQAEALVFETIKFSRIRKVVFFNDEDLDRHGSGVEGVDQCVDRSWLESRYSFLRSLNHTPEEPRLKPGSTIPRSEIPY